ncbi:hypothetical protein L211DRAFT_832484 [Terfezia boudieri ATCC MYA-4762]|uniref:Uncharacterized protein n=1 Tax=Terfezia boudieri ATCC MYA-4762 TaxID=1051890 RepID=A0A3N4M7X7_9PEZI|nr:hypothetical protein L211DRAFT_832484 [Terfezia boudieri ATCC MYA-4762]
MAPRNVAYVRPQGLANRPERGYASGGTAAPKPKSRALRYLWRATLLSAIGGAA